MEGIRAVFLHKSTALMMMMVLFLKK